MAPGPAMSAMVKHSPALMITLGDTNRACIALAEFSETYPALATGRLKEQYDRDRAKVTCQG